MNMPPQCLRVLLVDDSRDTVETLAELLPLISPVPLTIALAFNGEQAVLHARSHAPPDVVILDIEMPGMNGFEAAAAIRQVLGDNSPLLIAVSGNAHCVDIAVSEGTFDHALRKPFDPHRLIALMDHKRTLGCPPGQ